MADVKWFAKLAHHQKVQGSIMASIYIHNSEKIEIEKNTQNTEEESNPLPLDLEEHVLLLCYNHPRETIRVCKGLIRRRWWSSGSQVVSLMNLFEKLLISLEHTLLYFFFK